MTFESSYNDLLLFATSLIKAKSVNLGLLPEDLINEAFIENADKPFNLETYKKSIRNYFIKETKLPNFEYFDQYEISKKKNNREDSRICRTCNEVLPIAAFRVRSRGDIYTDCRECENKIRRKDPSSKSAKIKPQIILPEIAAKFHHTNHKKQKRHEKMMIKNFNLTRSLIDIIRPI